MDYAIGRFERVGHLQHALPSLKVMRLAPAHLACRCCAAFGAPGIPQRRRHHLTLILRTLLQLLAAASFELMGLQLGRERQKEVLEASETKLLDMPRNPGQAPCTKLSSCSNFEPSQNLNHVRCNPSSLTKRPWARERCTRIVEQAQWLCFVRGRLRQITLRKTSDHRETQTGECRLPRVTGLTSHVTASNQPLQGPGPWRSRA